jgi:transcriptional regulator with XRE-family HTH domain
MTNRPKEYTSKIIDEILSEISPDEFLMTEKKMLLAARIDDAIKARGWQKQDLAKALHKRPSEISKWLSGIHNFTTETLWEIEKILGTDFINLKEQDAEETITRFKPAMFLQQVAEKTSSGKYEIQTSNLNIVSEPDSIEYSGKGKTREGKTSKGYTVKLKTLELIDFSIICPRKQKSETKEFNFNINIEHKINKEKKIVFVIVSVDIIHEDKVTRLGNLKGSCNFEIPDLNTFILPGQPNQINLPSGTIDLLNSVSVSTIRGIMFSTFKGTFLHNAVLPVIDPKTFKEKPDKVKPGQ